MDRRHFLATTASLATVPSFALAQNKDVIRIVSSLPRTGSAKGQTDAIVNGIKLAIAQTQGVAAGFKIEYTDLDDATAAAGQWEAVKEADNAREAIADADVMAYIGTYNSGAAKVSMPILNEASLVQISPAATWPGLTQKVDEKSGEPVIYRPTKKITFCRVCPTDYTQGPLAANFARSELKTKSVYILDDRETYGGGVAHAFAKRCKELEIEILGHESVDPKQPNYRTLMKLIKDTKPEAVYFGGHSFSGGPKIARDFAASEMTCPLILPDGCYEQAFIDGAGADNVNGRCYVTIGGVDVKQYTGRAAAFAKRYKEKFKDEPEAWAIYGYEAAKVVLAAIQTAGKKDREAIRKAVLATKDFDQGALEKWSFDANGDTTLQQITVSKIEDAKFVPKKVVTAKSPA